MFGILRNTLVKEGNIEKGNFQYFNLKYCVIMHCERRLSQTSECDWSEVSVYVEYSYLMENENKFNCLYFVKLHN